MQAHFSCDAVGRFFDSALDARGAFSRASVQMAIHWRPVALDFYFGQFCSFSAQDWFGVEDFNPFTAHRPVRKRFLARVRRSDKLQKLPKMKHFVFRWAITTIAVMVASSIIHGIRYDTVASLIGAALLLGILNAFVRPILLILSVPLILLTLGFFILILNALMLFFVPSIVIGFHVDSFWSAFWGAIVVSIVSWILSAFFRGSDGRVHVLTHHTQIRPVRGRVIEPGERR